MQTKKTFSFLRVALRFALLMTSVTALAALSACSVLGGGGTSQAQNTPSLWSHNQDFVRLQQVDARNQQPLDITTAQVRDMLSRLKVQWRNGRVQPVFSSSILNDIASPIAQGLRNEHSGTDVIFAATFKPQEPGIVKNIFAQRRVTTGRLFYNGQSLNLIFGLMHHSIEQQVLAGARDIPRTPGERSKRLSTGWEIEPASHIQRYSSSRSDWALISSAAWETVAQGTNQGTTSTRPQANAQASQPASHRTGSQQGQATPSSNPYYQKARERLQALQNLRNDGLITQQEYEKERARLLKQLGSMPTQ